MSVGSSDDVVVEAGDGHAALVVVQVGDDAPEHADRVDRRAAEHAGVKVAAGAVNHHLFQHEAAQHRGDGRGLGVPHQRVADERHVGAQLLLVLVEEGRQRRRPRLLLASSRTVTWQGKPPVSRKARQASTKVISWPLSSAVPRPAICLPPGASTSLGSKALVIVHRSSGSAGLHVVMAVEQHARHVGPRRLAVATTIGCPAVGRTEASKPIAVSSSAAHCAARSQSAA